MVKESVFSQQIDHADKKDMANAKEKHIPVEASLGVSEKWDAREAGREVARTAIEKLSHPPKFFLLFSTIHYEKHGGFQELLNGVYDVLPADTPLVGGTVAGFMNNFGVYVHGATALAVSHPNMDLAVWVKRIAKRNLKKINHIIRK